MCIRDSDNTLMQDRLRKELARLQEFQQRRDLAVADMIALSQRMAEAEAQLQAAEQQGAQHRRRIDTQLLTLHFQPPGSEEGRNEVVQALRDFGGGVDARLARAIVARGGGRRDLGPRCGPTFKCSGKLQVVRSEAELLANERRPRVCLERNASSASGG